MSERCGYTVLDAEGIEQPCDRPATGWRWYQDCGHEDLLDVACDWHANEGGRRIHAAEARHAALVAAVKALEAECAGSGCIHLNDMWGRLNAILAEHAEVEPGPAGGWKYPQPSATSVSSIQPMPNPYAALEPWCHPECVLGAADHPGYLGYRCIDEHGQTLPFPGEEDRRPAAPSVPTEDTDAKEGER